jgi:hypothetical protein
MLRPLEVLLERSVSEEAEKLGGRKRAGAKADKPTTVRHSDQVCSLVQVQVQIHVHVQVQPWRPFAAEITHLGEDIFGGGVSRLVTLSFTFSVCAVDVLGAIEAKVDSAGN